MRRTTKVSVVITLGLLAVLLVGGVAMAGGDSLVDTWHSRDSGFSNIFWFVDNPISGVYPVLYYDDATGTIVCGDNGPMLWVGFGQITDPNTLEGTFGDYWCPNNGVGMKKGLLDFSAIDFFTLIYDPDTDTISARLAEFTACLGTRQPHINTVKKAKEELQKGRYPPVVFPPEQPLGCDG